MPMPESYWTVYPAFEGPYAELYEHDHSVSVLLPWRRYAQHVRPQPCEGSPSMIEVGEETRHGALLTVTRRLPGTERPVEVEAEMLGELAEAWWAMRAPVKRTT